MGDDYRALSVNGGDDGAPSSRLTRFGAISSGLTPLQVFRRQQAVRVLQESERRSTCGYWLAKFRGVIALALLLGLAAALAFTVFRSDVGPPGPILKVASIPLVSVVFTYFHIYLALYMMFWPLERSWRSLGWQGIVPMKAEKMARISVDMMTQRLIRVEDIFARIDPDRVSALLGPTLDGLLGRLIDEVANEDAPEVWAALPGPVRAEIVAKAAEESPAVVAALMDEVKRDIGHVFDLKRMVVEALTRDKTLLNLMFLRTGAKELAYIKYLGAQIGFLCGLVQAAVYVFYNAVWVLPVTGFLVGYGTNALALKIIFSPVDPVEVCCGWTVQGLFLKRQEEVSADYAELVTTNILSSRNVIDAIIRGPGSDRLFEITARHIHDGVDRYAGPSRHALLWVVGSDQYEESKRRVCDRLLSALPQYADSGVRASVEKYTDEAMDLENVLFERMTALPSRDFERLLHSVFEEEEILLIVLGGLLGAAIGYLQYIALGS